VTSALPVSPPTPLALGPDRRVLVALKPVWRNGTSDVLFEPFEFLANLAAIYWV
jgi:hypothetical protein